MEKKSEIIRTARLFEFYVKYLWPLHRLLVKSKISRRCNNCAASEKMIPIAQDGRCDLCSKGSQGVVANIDNSKEQKDFKTLLASYQGKGAGQFDALVLFSGGKDSTYMIRRIQNEFPQLRMLAMTVDNGFMSPVAKENIEELLPKLGVDHIFIKPKKEFYVRLFRYAITHLNAAGSYGTVDFSDGEFLLDCARNLAAEKRIPLILCGYSRYQVQNGLKLASYESPRSCEKEDRTEVAGLALSNIFEASDVRYWWHGSKWPTEQIARLLFPLYAWNLEEDEIKQNVQTWGLLSEKSHSPIVTNHQLIPLLGVVDVHKFGYSSFEFEFCRMIREGKAKKEEWQPVFEFLEYTARTGLFIRPAVDSGLEQLNLKTSDVGIVF